MKSLAGIIYACFCSCAYLGLTGCCNENSGGKVAASEMSPELAVKLSQSNLLYEITQEPDYKEQTRQFLERARRTQKPDRILAWGLEILEAHKNGKGGFELPSDELPSFIKSLDPDSGEPRVWGVVNSNLMIDWGGGFGHWGLRVEGGQTQSPCYLYTIDWVPGLKAYHSLQ